MPRSGGDAAPREYISRGQWPTGTLRKDAPASARYSQEFVNRLLKALQVKGHPSLRSIEREARVSRRTVERVLAGEVLPDFGALARLEQWLDADLWPGRDLRSKKEQE